MKSEHSFFYRIFQTIQQRLSPKPKQQCRACGEWYKPSQLLHDGICRECKQWGA